MRREKQEAKESKDSGKHMIVEVEVKESALTSRALPQNVNSIAVTCTQRRKEQRIMIHYDWIQTH